LFLFFFVYAVVGMNIFGSIKWGQYLSRHANFSNVGLAMLTLFRMITGETWDGIMQDCMITSDCILVTQVRIQGIGLAIWRQESTAPLVTCCDGAFSGNSKHQEMMLYTLVNIQCGSGSLPLSQARSTCYSSS
jgi:hypothetical protein